MSLLKEWIQDHLVAPARELIDDTPLGGEVDDLDRLHGRDGLCLGIEGVVRALVDSEYASWPRGSTTDGLIADLCVKTGPANLEFVGMCFIDFSGKRFPLRAAMTLSDDLRNLVRFAAYIGNVDSRSGAPPQLPPSSMILPERDEDGRNPVPYVVVKHRLVPITWTEVFSIDAADLDQHE